MIVHWRKALSVLANAASLIAPVSECENMCSVCGKIYSCQFLLRGRSMGVQKAECGVHKHQSSIGKCQMKLYFPVHPIMQL